MSNNYKLEIKWGLIFLSMSLIWMILEKISGLHDENLKYHQYFTSLIFFPAVTVYVLALKDKKKKYYNGVMSYKQGFITGLIITLVVTILSAPHQYIISTYISPTYFENVIKYSVENKILTEKIAKEQFNLKNYMLQATIGAAIMGTLTSAVVAFFVKSKQK